ncbi:efflux RND transporter periplasmic adaptor subunit [Cohnella fermenti]|uniref:HlyD family efflux transporter periplasmic adaptor subunit n=1 Tax=Cohnella fermenti TaxID=2565925 RepID=A0A4S4BKI4_9BACL|nr:HlyD family efflux transporter periplasmic adaptor subunit [Cohnella fermenti]THF75135.1 HlyD family efflux transporter periplasmic adaptor subunit [Cohnella fermenti]
MSLQGRKLGFPALALALSLALSLSGCSLLPQEEEALAPPLIKPAKENYQTVNAEKGDIVVAINGTAYFESVHTEVAQFTGTGGRVQEMLVNSGQEVKQGDVLVQLVMEDLDLKLKEQELALERAKISLKQVRTDSSSEEEVIRMAALQVQIEQLKYDRLESQYDSKQLVSPIDGVVTFVEDLEPGDYVDTYQTLVIVADPTQLRLTLGVDSSDNISDVNVGFPVQIKVRRDGETKELGGKVVQTPSSAPQTLNKTLAEKYARTLYIDPDALPEGIEIGTMADVTITTKEKQDVVKIPRSGLRNSLGRTFVRTLVEGTKLREVDVEAGLSSATEIEIVNGLKEGDVVVLQ